MCIEKAIRNLLEQVLHECDEDLAKAARRLGVETKLFESWMSVAGFGRRRELFVALDRVGATIVTPDDNLFYVKKLLEKAEDPPVGASIRMLKKRYDHLKEQLAKAKGIIESQQETIKALAEHLSGKSLYQFIPTIGVTRKRVRGKGKKNRMEEGEANLPGNSEE